MRHIGGEFHYKYENINIYLTDSGRSSIRLILESSLKNKKILLPEYLCEVILWVFDDLKVNYSFYKVNPDLSINFESIKNIDYDVIYIINYFGNKSIDSGCNFYNNKIILEDCVFLPDFANTNHFKNWIGFNSFRKISPIADGSMIKSTIPLNAKLIKNREAKFAQIKYNAKQIKYEYLFENKHNEKKYLELFEKGESLINQQKEICTISQKSIVNLFYFFQGLEKEKSIRKANYLVLEQNLSHLNIKIHTDFYSLFVLFVDQREDLRKNLFKHNIFLPVHWPKIKNISNILYDKIISIPVDSRYTIEDILFVSEKINNFYLKG